MKDASTHRFIHRSTHRKIPIRTVLLIIALMLSIFMRQWSTMSSTSQCAITAGCVDNRGIIGTSITERWGFPAPYHEVSKFMPVDQAHYVETSIDSISIFLVIVDTIFWYALLDFIWYRLLPFLYNMINKRSSRASRT